MKSYTSLMAAFGACIGAVMLIWLPWYSIPVCAVLGYLAARNSQLQDQRVVDLAAGGGDARRARNRRTGARKRARKRRKRQG